MLQQIRIYLADKYIYIGEIIYNVNEILCTDNWQKVPFERNACMVFILL